VLAGAFGDQAGGTSGQLPGERPNSRGGSCKAAPAFDLASLRFEPAPEMAGEWSMVSGVLSGQPLDKMMTKYGKRVVEGNKMTVSFGPQLYAKAKFMVDRSKTPMAIDYYNTAATHLGKIQHGIYELEGKTLKLCMAAPGEERPTAFTSAPGSGAALTVWALGRK